MQMCTNDFIILSIIWANDYVIERARVLWRWNIVVSCFPLFKDPLISWTLAWQLRLFRIRGAHLLHLSTPPFVETSALNTRISPPVDPDCALCFATSKLLHLFVLPPFPTHALFLQITRVLANNAPFLFYLYFCFEGYLESILLKPYPDKTRCDLFLYHWEPFKPL